MKRDLLGSTALAGVVGVMSASAGAAEAPAWTLSGNLNFQFYYVDQDLVAFTTKTATKTGFDVTKLLATVVAVPDARNQDHGWYFGVDEAELQLDVSGTADNGLSYGFKIEINANTTDGMVADEARIQLSGSWGTLQLGDEDGAEDAMNYGGEDVMGATGGFDGDFDDVLIRRNFWIDGQSFFYNAPSYPTIAGDTADSTKLTYYSPRFSGFQVGVSATPTLNQGDDFKEDRGLFEDHYGIGANYDNSFGNLRIQVSAVYSTASSRFSTEIEDVSAWSVGGIVGWGPFSLGANYTDNGDSLSPVNDPPWETGYWNVAAGFETGALYLSAGYFSSYKEFVGSGVSDSTFENIALTADYTLAPGLGFYAEVDLIENDIVPGSCPDPWCNSDATILIMGANVSF